MTPDCGDDETESVGDVVLRQHKSLWNGDVWCMAASASK